MFQGREPKFVDLFAGIGGFHLALSDALSARCVFASEIDEACRQVYESNFGIRPDGDIRPLTEGQSILVPEHDILCAGFPCQPFSKSGFQRGIGETRGTLFYNILRVIEARRPQFVLLENVRNLAGPRHRDTWKTIITNLRRLGYRVSEKPTVFSPHLLPPWMDGRPQIRDRVFIPAEYVAEGSHPDELIGPVSVPYAAVAGWDPQSWDINNYLDDDAGQDLSKYRLRSNEIAWLEVWNDLLKSLPPGRLPGFPIWADHFVADPVIDDDLPRWKRDFLMKNSQFYRANRAVIDAWLKRHDGLRDLPPSRRKLEWQAQDEVRDIWRLVIHLRPSGIRLKRSTYLPALVAITQTSLIGPRKRRITPREAARLQGFPEWFALHPDDGVAYRQLGNAVNVGAVKYVANSLLQTASRSPTEVSLQVAS